MVAKVYKEPRVTMIIVDETSVFIFSCFVIFISIIDFIKTSVSKIKI